MYAMMILMWVGTLLLTSCEGVRGESGFKVLTVRHVLHRGDVRQQRRVTRLHFGCKSPEMAGPVPCFE